ncbi:OPT superfamily oligopeptide transporter [Daedalea quercina L-15889]|uniref:OPT superfamily oligopeptide transporter n=1 Tax=Daedalea quercina L-15889 TaxID=1314783 RepID=A0A165KMB4_9APHY|nr:OPT superfamily oligopeptide transporter [Daedalea quercina L-15889]
MPGGKPESSSATDLSLQALPPSLPNESWLSKDDTIDRLRVSSEIPLLSSADDIPDEAALTEEPRVQEPYEVALKVLTTVDYPELSAVTFRSIFLGIGFSAFGAVLAQIYYFKPQNLSVSALLLLILSFALGNAMHSLLPSKGVFKWINPGPFNIKEHAAIVIMASTASTSATAIQVIAVQELFYDHSMNAGVAIFTLLASQLIGYGFAGLLQDVLVKPTKCFWPASIQTANLFQALHYDRQMSSKRVRLFWIVFGVLFCWEIVPEWIFPVLTGISIFCLADNHSPVIRNIFGGASSNEGMGMLQLCLDWNIISSLCFWAPLSYQLNIDIGIFLAYTMMAAIYYGNVWGSLSFPFMSQSLYTSNGTIYDQTAILTNGKFDPVKYAELGPAYLSGTFVWGLISSNLSLGALFTHVCLWHWKDLKPFIQSLNPRSRVEVVVNDPHWEKMKAYKQIPRWWYVLVLIGAYATAQATNYTGHSGLPWWALTVVLLISFTLTTLYGILDALIGFASNATAFYEMITAYLVPGDPVANMYGSLYGGQPMVQAFAFLGDLKLGQYVKLAPRVTFCMQMAGTVVGGILNYVVALSIIDTQRDALLSVSGTRLWSGLNIEIYNTSAVAWGALGPHMFNGQALYRMVPISLAIGLFLPLPFYIAHRVWPNVGFQYFNTSVILQYSGDIYGGINSYINTSMVIGLFTQWWVRTRYPRWFVKYNYLVAAAMDAGTQVIIFILNFALFGAAGTAISFPQWWGNDYNLSADRCLLPPS